MIGSRLTKSGQKATQAPLSLIYQAASFSWNQRGVRLCLSHISERKKRWNLAKKSKVRTNNLTQEQFATQLHVTRQSRFELENNRNLPDLEMLIAIATIFNSRLMN